MTTRINAATAVAARDNALFIDVRSPKGRSDNGELSGAIIVAKDQIAPLFGGPLAAAKDSRIVVFCGSVAGSGPAVETLRGLGFDAVDVDGGHAALREAGWA